MTIKEAIYQLDDLKKDRKSFAENDEPDGVFEQDIEAIDIAINALEENDKLKQLLKLAIEDFCKVRNICEWKHAEEVKEVLENERI